MSKRTVATNYGRSCSPATSFPFLATGSVVCAVALILTNKLLFSSFNYPITVTWVHQLFGTIFSQALSSAGVVKAVKLTHVEAMMMAATFCGGLVFMNFSLAANSVGFYQIFKLLCTPCVALLQYFLLGRGISVNMSISLAVLLLGVGIATVTDFASNLWGALLGTLAVLFTSYSQVYMNRTQAEHAMNSLQTLMVISPYSFFILGLCAFALEFQGAAGFFAFSLPWNDMFVLVASGVLAIASNYFGFAIIGTASPVTYQVVGHTKTCLTVLLGVVLFTKGTSHTTPLALEYIVRTMVGLVIAILGLVMFALANRNDVGSSSSGGSTADSTNPRKSPPLQRRSDSTAYAGAGSTSLLSKSTLIRVLVAVVFLFLAYISLNSLNEAHMAMRTSVQAAEEDSLLSQCPPCDSATGRSDEANVIIVREPGIATSCPECTCPACPEPAEQEDCSKLQATSQCFDGLHTTNSRHSIGVVYVLGLRSPVIAAYAKKFADDKARQDSYVNELRHSVTSLRATNPRLPVTLFVDTPGVIPSDMVSLFTEIIHQSEIAKVEWGDKVISLPMTPYDRTIFLDNDVTICEDLTPVFGLINHYDMAAVLEPRLVHEIKRFARADAMFQYSSFNLTHYNSGMLLFKKSNRMNTLFRNWRTEHESHRGGGDQYFLAQLLPSHDIRVLTLPPEYNLRFNDNIVPVFVHSSIKVLHTRTAIKNPSKLSCEIVNEFKTPRLIDPIRHNVYHFYIDDAGLVRTVASADQVEKNTQHPFNTKD